MSTSIYKSPIVIRIAAVGVGLLAAVFIAVPGYAAPTVHCGDVVTIDVTLQADLVCAGDGLIVDGSNVSVSLHGHTIRGSGTGHGIRFADGSAPHADVDITDGTIGNFATGIELAGGDNDILIKYVRLTGNGRGLVGSIVDNIEVRGVEITGSGDAVAMDGSTAVTLASTRVTGGRIIAFNTSDAWVIKGCVLTGVHVDFAEANNSAVMNSRLTGGRVDIDQANQITILNNDLIGARVSYGSGHNGVIRGNRFSLPAGGIDFDTASGESTNVQIERNTFTGTTVGVRVVRPTFDEINDLTISYNTFDGNGAAGVFVQTAGALSGPISIHDNVFTGNGFAPGGLVDSAGRPVDDGLHTAVPLGTDITVARNSTAHNADHGIEALPIGSVVDGGGNQSTGDPVGCAGVICT